MYKGSGRIIDGEENGKRVTRQEAKLEVVDLVVAGLRFLHLYSITQNN